MSDEDNRQLQTALAKCIAYGAALDAAQEQIEAQAAEIVALKEKSINDLAIALETGYTDGHAAGNRRMSLNGFVARLRGMVKEHRRIPQGSGVEEAYDMLLDELDELCVQPSK